MPHSQYQTCIDACVACALACDHCAASCLMEADVKTMARCISLDIDCAATCRLASAAMARGSESALLICEACAEICERCEEECAKHAMEHCQVCAEACRRCAKECRAMGGARRGQSHQAGTETRAHP